MSKQRSQWQSKTFKLPADHGWKCSPGHGIFVADQGAVQFEYPSTWVVAPIDGDIAIAINDKQHPDDNVRIAVSVLHLPQNIDWGQVPIDILIRKGFQCKQPNDVRRNLTWQDSIHISERGGIESAWAEADFVDPAEERPARTRACIARGGRDYFVQTQITMDYWLDDSGRFEPVWDHALATLRLGEIIPNPLTRRDR
jgi:hypothetical protein